jgi:hypothetical protein
MSHWKQRRRAVDSDRARIRSHDVERLIDPDFDEVAIDEVLEGMDLDPDLRSGSDE